MSRPPLERLAGLFVAPASEAARAAPETRPRRRPRRRAEARAAAARTSGPAAVAVVCVPGHAGAASAAAVRALLRGATGPVVLCRWAPRARPEAPALLTRPAARRLAAALARRGHGARPRGRVVVVDLPAEAREAAGEVPRIAAAAGGAPIVLLLAHPRDEAWDGLLAEQDHVLVAGDADADADDPLVALAVTGLGAALGASRVGALALGRGRSGRRASHRAAVRALADAGGPR